MENRKLSADNMSELKIKEVVIPRGVIVVSESLQSFVDTFSDLPEKLRNLICELLLFIEDEYYFYPSSEFGVEVDNDDYKIVYSYKEFLS